MQQFLSLILFIIALGVLITIHELGHFLTAKAFKVYCSDFSIGFGYKILKIGRKPKDEKKDSLFFINSKNEKRETTFSIGIFPLGGYVAMLGEDDNDLLKEKPELKGRSLEDISYWKKLIIMFAGIAMNFVLAFVIFFIAASCFEQSKVDYINVISVTDSSTMNKYLTYDIEGNEPIEVSSPVDYGNDDQNYYFLKTNAPKDETNSLIYSINDPTQPVVILNNTNYYSLIIDTSSVGYNDTDFSLSFKLVLAEVITNNGVNEYYPKLNDNKAYTYYTFSKGEEIKPISVSVMNNVTKEAVSGYLHLSLSDSNTINRLGFGTFVYRYWNGLNSLKVTGETFANSTSLIGRALFSLFYDSNAWAQVGGPVAIFNQTTTILASYPFYVYLNTWAVISVNLAIFNLLPFPGLDGWQILVTLIELTVNAFKKAKKKKSAPVVIEDSNNPKEINIGDKKASNDDRWKFPPKIKNIISYVGLFLLFGLMIVIFIKDIFGLF